MSGISNASPQPLSPDEMAILPKGPNIAAAPTRIPQVEIVSAV